MDTFPFPLNLSFKIVALAPQVRVTDAEGNPVCYVRQKLLKQPAFFEGKFRIEKAGDSDDDITILMAVLMAVLLERQRG